jgi:hypothetical protein
LLHKNVAFPYVSVHCIVVIIKLLTFDQLSFSPSCAAAADYDDNVASFAINDMYPATMPLFSQNT